MRKNYLLILLCLVLAACGGQAPPEKKTVLLISAAASLKDSLQEVKEQFEKENPSIEVRMNFGSTGSLQKQIEQGAPADLLISASKPFFTELSKKGYISPSLQMDYLGNELVMVTAKEDMEMKDLPDAEKISIGIPETVPAGAYAKEALEHYGIWSELEKKTVFAKDVRQVLSYVETGNVDAGIVYRTDAMQSQKVKQESIDPESYGDIVYPAGVLERTKHPKEAEAFYEFLKTDRAKQVFKKYGFTVLPAGEEHVD
ncbi:molybdate ABC transporter substrate-binding protein [Metabacillus indicus]|uniref:molybdate ABC transporter substrate-binding protein n=1 Tax=Metabacillus indicus TaxID=246786 RepID=UPI002490A549|nr:molybdate ABC transporter substrate-binding protein [Metabacillus indicus]